MQKNVEHWKKKIGTATSLQISPLLFTIYDKKFFRLDHFFSKRNRCFNIILRPWKTKGHGFSALKYLVTILGKVNNFFP